MKAEIETRRHIKCPSCGHAGSWIDHLKPGTSFGPWSCDNDECDAKIEGRVCEDGSVDIEVLAEKKERQGIALLKFGEAYFLMRERYGHLEDSADYMYHSHQCPTNLLHEVDEVFTADGGRDPHGLIRFIANMPFDAETWRKLHDESGTLQEVFAIFGTDGQPAPTAWPAKNRGVISWVADLQRENANKGNA